MTQDTDYFDVSAEDAKEERSRISRGGRTEKPASEHLLLSLEEERRICEILNPFLF